VGIWKTFQTSHCKQDFDSLFMSYGGFFFSFQMRAAWVGLLATDVGRQVLPYLEGQRSIMRGLKATNHGKRAVNPGLTAKGCHSGM
jgi:hypothetical protein